MTRAAVLGGLLALASCGGGHAGPAHPASASASASVHAAVAAELDAAETAERARQHEDARLHYERAVAAAGTSATEAALAHRDFGETLASWAELPGAVAEFEAVVAATPRDASAWHDLGILRHAAGDVPGSIAALIQARDLAPRDSRPRIALAALYWQTGQVTAATAEYRALLALDLPENVRAKVEWALQTLAKP